MESEELNGVYKVIFVVQDLNVFFDWDSCGKDSYEMSQLDDQSVEIYSYKQFRLYKWKVNDESNEYFDVIDSQEFFKVSCEFYSYEFYSYEDMLVVDFKSKEEDKYLKFCIFYELDSVFFEVN